MEQLFGRGLNSILTTDKTDRIAQTNFVPAFQQGKPGDGLEGMIISYNIILRAAAGSGKEAGKPGNSSNPLVLFYENISAETKENVFLLLIFGVLVVLSHYFSRWFGSRYERDHHRENHGDRDEFGGGSSEGGGGSSTRF